MSRDSREKRVLVQMICGDFNIDIRDVSSDDPLLQVMETQGFHQLVLQPTTDYGSLIDHVYVNFAEPKVMAKVVDCYYSDHDIIVIEVTI